MRRITATLAAAALVLAACGGDDDEPAAEDVLPASDAENDDANSSGVAPEEEPADEPADEPAGEDPADDSDSFFEDDDGDDGGTISVNSIDDVPEVCRELMAEFLRDIEPIVAPIDWDNATLADFESIADQFDEISEEFDSATEAEAACDNIEMEDEDDFALLVEFAGDVAPGTVGFMEFISGFATAAGEMADTGDDGTGGVMGGDGEAFETCDEALEWLQSLLDQYDSIAEVPVNQMMEIANLGSVMTTCTPEQLEILNSPEFEEFMAGI